MDGWMEEEDGSLNGLTIRAPNGANKDDCTQGIGSASGEKIYQLNLSWEM